MLVSVTGRNLKITDALTQYVEKKVDKFSKMFNEELNVKATFSTQKNNHVVEIMIPLKQGAILRAEASSEDMYASVDEAVDKLSRQIRKHKTKLEKRYHSGGSIRFEEIPDWSEPLEDQKVVKVKRFDLAAMSVEEAQLQLELIGHDFFVFESAETGLVSVIYKRKDGDFGLIEPRR